MLNIKTPKIIDTHTHVQMSDFDVDRDQVIQRAQVADIWMINVGADEKSSQQAVDLANQRGQSFYASVGIHPNEVQRQTEIDFKKIEALGSEEKVVAIGECGLDYFRIKTSEIVKKQRELFCAHLQLAKKFKKPLIIHCRPSKNTQDAYENLFEILSDFFCKTTATATQQNGVIHFYQGTKEIAEKFFDLGFLVSFSGVITFDNKLHEIVKSLPLENILVETDAGWVAPVPYRGQRNEPAYIVETIKKIAEIRGVSPETVSNQTTENAIKLFNLINNND